MPIFCIFLKFVILLPFAIKSINTLYVFYEYLESKKHTINNNPLTTQGVRVFLRLFSPISGAAFLSNDSTVRFEPAVKLKILLLKSLSILSVAFIELQQKIHTISVHADDEERAFCSASCSLLCNKNVNKFLNLKLSMLRVCSKTEF